MMTPYQQFGPKNQQPSFNPQILQPALAQARQIASSTPNIQQYVLQQLGVNIPPQIQNDPDQIIRYLQANNMLNPMQQAFMSFLQSGQL